MWYLLLVLALVSLAQAATYPYDLPQFQPVLSKCRLQCPDTSPSIVSGGNFDGVELPDRFYLNDTRMVLEMKQETGKRCELRHDPEWSTASTVNVAQTYKATLRVTPSNQTNGVTIMQVHSKKFLEYISGPPLMLGWRRNRNEKPNNLWVKIRTNLSATSKKIQYFDLDIDPTVDFFELQVTIWQRVLYVWVNGNLRLQYDWGFLDPLPRNYFKTGVYMHYIQDNEPHLTEYLALSMGPDPDFSLGEDVPSAEPSTAPSTTLSWSPSFTPSTGPSMAPSSVPSSTPSESPVISELPRIEALFLVDANSNQDLMMLSGHMILDQSSLPPFSIRAEASGVGSVVFLTNGSPKTENYKPYVIAGDQKGNYHPWLVSTGFYEIVVIPYSERKLQGTEGSPVVVQLTII